MLYVIVYSVVCYSFYYVYYITSFHFILYLISHTISLCYHISLYYHIIILCILPLHLYINSN